MKTGAVTTSANTNLGRLLGLAAVMLYWAGVSVLPAGEAPVLQQAPVNPEFVAWQQAPAAPAPAPQGRALGHVPAPVNLAHLTTPRLPTGQRPVNRAAPTYDWRTADPAKLPPVRNQGPYGTCWAHAAYAGVESWLRPGETPDYSERHLAFLHGFDAGYDDGGNSSMSTAYLVRWAGPVAESDCPYSGMPTPPSGTEPVQKHVQEVLFLPTLDTPANRDLLKDAIVANGAIDVYYYHDDAYYNDATHAYYRIGSGSNHEVAAIGWDDNFSAANFNSPPPGDGAWIIRNSWSGGWGDGGYFYISYYDGGLAGCNPTVYRTIEATSKFTQVYQYDPLGWVSDLGYNSTAGTPMWCANIYATSASGVLGAAGFYTTDSNATYELYVYRGVTAGQPRSGTACGIGPGGATVLTGSFTYAGYHTVEFVNPVSLTGAQNVSVVVKLTTPDYPYPAAVEYVVNGYSSAATANPGQSYYSSAGSTWTDLTSWRATANFCLKLFAINPNQPPVAADDSYSVPHDWVGEVTAAPGVLANDTDAEGDPLTAVLDSGVSHGTLTLDADGSFSYAATPGYVGTDSFTYHANDTHADSNMATVTLTVWNSLPVAADDSYGTTEDTALTVVAPGVLGNDTDPNADPLTAVKVSDPAHGTVTLNADGSFTYTPAANYHGSDSFTYRANDGAANSNTATVSLTVTAVNDPPVIVSAAWADANPVTLPAGTTVHVVASDPDGDPLTYAWSQVSGTGTVTFATPDAAASGVTFSAAGTYVLRVTVTDGQGGSVASDVSITAISDVDPRADLNGDHAVNALDLQIVIANFGMAVGSPGCDPRADANADSVVNALDLQILIANFGKTVP